MKQILNKFLILVIALTCSLAMSSCTTSEKTTSDSGTAGGTEQPKAINTGNKQITNNENKTPSEKKVLRDYRNDSDDIKPQNISEAETAAVMKYLLGDTWDKELMITSRIQGAFTKPNAKETLYFITGCKDDDETFISNATCGHVGWNTAGWIVIYDGTTPIMKIEEALGYRIEKVTDINGDGISEILSNGGYAQSGIQTESASLGQISGGKYQDIKTYRAYADNCAFGPTPSDDKKKAVSVLINYDPKSGKEMPDFSEEYFQGQCKNDEADKSSWKKITKKEFDEFFDSIS